MAVFHCTACHCVGVKEWSFVEDRMRRAPGGIFVELLGSGNRECGVSINMEAQSTEESTGFRILSA